MATSLTLEQVDAAIATVLKQQKYKLGDREFTFANLQELRDLRNDMKAEAAQAAGGLFMKVRFKAVT